MNGAIDRVTQMLESVRRGELPPRIAYMQLAMAAASAEELAGLLTRLAGRPGVEAVTEVAAANPDGWRIVNSILSAVSHDDIAEGPDHIAAIAAMFDRAVALSPEASVAAYSLGDPAALAVATEEIAAWLDSCGVLGPEVRLLDFGCGIGRLEIALAERVNSVVGLDVSGAMVAEARRRCAGLGNVAIEQISGRHLAQLGDGSFGMVVALDSFPYVVAADENLPSHLLGEIFRVLSAGGELVILNYSYRGDPERDRLELMSLAAANGFSLTLAGEQPFRLWDGLAFRLKKPAS